MGTFGWTSPNWQSGWVFFGFNTENNVSSDGIAFPENGTITSIVFNCALLSGSGGPMVANGCIWDNAGNLLVGGSQVSLPADGQHAGPYPWNTSTCSLAVTGGQVIRMGWWRNPASGAGDNIFGFGSGGSYLLGTTANSGGPGGFGQDSSSGGTIGVYVNYTPSGGPPPPVTPQFQRDNKKLYALHVNENVIPL